MRIRCRDRRLLLVVAWGMMAAANPSQQPNPSDRAAAIIAELRSGSVEARRAAANAVRSSDGAMQRQALPALIDRLQNEKDGQVRLGVLDAVTALGPDAVAAVPALLQTLRTNYGGSGQEESHQDYRSALALAAVGKPAVEGLRGLLHERKEGVRAEVVMALGRIGPDAAAAVPDLVPLLGDGSERVRQEAAVALGQIGPSAVDPLIAAAGSAETRISQAGRRRAQLSRRRR